MTTSNSYAVTAHILATIEMTCLCASFFVPAPTCWMLMGAAAVLLITQIVHPKLRKHTFLK